MVSICESLLYLLWGLDFVELNKVLCELRFALISILSRLEAILKCQSVADSFHDVLPYEQTNLYVPYFIMI